MLLLDLTTVALKEAVWDSHQHVTVVKSAIPFKIVAVT